MPTIPTPKPDIERFIDLKSDAWYSEYAEYVISKGLMAGTSENTFSPDEPLTRGMLVTILHRAAGLPVMDHTSKFSDVASSDWFSDGVSWAAANGVVMGYDDGMFYPNKDISRQELAVILWRYAQMVGLDVSSNGTILPDFADRDQIAPWAAEAMAWAYRTGIITGRSNGKLDPTSGATRIEAAAMLVRFLRLLEANANPVE